MRAPAVVVPLVAAAMSAIGAVGAGPTLCPIALVTGTACPGCGMTRAIVALLRGDLSSSWDAHPLAAVVVGQATLAAAWWAAARWGRVAAPSAGRIAAAAAVTGVGLVVVWLVRVATATLPTV